jgi:putative DNA primase/helicase
MSANILDYKKASQLSAKDSTEIAAAERLVRRCDNRNLYVPALGWVAYDGTRFGRDQGNLLIKREAMEDAKQLWDLRGVPAHEQKDRIAMAKASSQRRGIESAVSLAAALPGVSREYDVFDADPWVLNTPSGVIDLKTGKLTAHSPSQLLTRIVGAPWIPGAAAPRWQQFLEQVLPDPEVRAYLQRFVGYCLTGLTDEQVLLFAWGGGANGKSVLFEVLLRLLGDYAQGADPGLLTKARDIPNDIARLKGVRFVSLNETQQGSRFDEAKLKQLTGGDTLTGEFKYGEFFDFQPKHKLAMRGNYKPAITGTDAGIWRRLHLVPFTVAIPPEERDHRLLDKLLLELPGILQWSVAGCIEWQRMGLAPPAAISAALEQYRQEADVLGSFITEKCSQRRVAQEKASTFQKAFFEYCRDMDEKPIPAKDLPAELQRRGYGYRRANNGRFYEGIEIDHGSAFGDG